MRHIDLSGNLCVAFKHEDVKNSHPNTKIVSLKKKIPWGVDRGGSHRGDDGVRSQRGDDGEPGSDPEQFQDEDQQQNRWREEPGWSQEPAQLRWSWERKRPRRS